MNFSKLKGHIPLIIFSNNCSGDFNKTPEVQKIERKLE
ncbi:MAG: hypothetical protein JWP00_4553 [Chloroflexi bacterium]|nr:hypothetical protein [Chloroflexota bacterium]